MSQYLQNSPVPDKVSLQAEHSLTQGEGDLDGDSDEGGEPGPHVLHHQHEADHEAADAAHPGQHPHQAVPELAPSAAAKGSEIYSVRLFPFSFLRAVYVLFTRKSRIGKLS